ncbi:MAG: arylformamidase [Bacteroidia bacterium]|nr:MAG: arylformamidase [Bacteroidia bacterium]
MIATIFHKGETYKVDLSHPMPISIPIQHNNGVRAWYVDFPKIEPVKMGNWVGEVKQGGSVNFKDIYFNPHGHCTHTECVGHITPEDISIFQTLRNYFFKSKLISVLPEYLENGDKVITQQSLLPHLNEDTSIDALIIRTIPNDESKFVANYSNTNPIYLTKYAVEYIVQKNVQHLILDLPSIDKEKDDGQLIGHKTFWNYPVEKFSLKTITELAFIPNSILDDWYFLNLQIAPLHNDATPSNPVLYRLVK